MKILDHLREVRRGRVASRVGRSHVEYEAARTITPHMQQDHWQWHYCVTVHCTLSGPDSAREAIANRAQRILARELYGELEDDVRDAMEIAMEEEYRPAGDPLLEKLDSILRKIRGEGAK